MWEYIHQFEGLVTNLLPGILGALLVLVVGWLIAIILKRIVYSLMKKTQLDERLLGSVIVDTNMFIAKLVYYLVMIIVMLTVLEMMGVSYVLDPIRNMLDELLGFIPNILAGVAIIFVGYIIAKAVSNFVHLAANFTKNVTKKLNTGDSKKIIFILQKFVFFLVLIPFVIQGLHALHLESITNPANHVLLAIVSMFPNVIGAILIIAIFVYGGKFLTTFLSDLLAFIDNEKMMKKLELSSIFGTQKLSALIANIVYFFLVFFGVISGIEMLQLDRLTEVLHSMLNLSGDLLFGLLILAIGNFFASFIFKSMTSSKDKNSFLASIAKVAVMGLFLAIALRTMGIANSIVELAFGLTLGAIAVAVALAYGLGGREAAGKHMEDILKKLRGK